MHTTACILLEWIGRLDFRVALAPDHGEAVTDIADERFMLCSDDLYGMAVQVGFELA